MLSQIESAFRQREASERKLRRFVADASHELRTPLAAVRAYAELLRPRLPSGGPGALDDGHQPGVGADEPARRRPAALAASTTAARSERVPVQLDEVVGEAVETAQAVEPERPIELHADTAVVVGDRDRLRQIVDNLLANVRAHTPPGTPVSVSVSRRNGTAAIAVTDSGPGSTKTPRARLRALLPRGLVACPRQQGRGPRALDRRRGDGGARRHRLGPLGRGRERRSRSHCPWRATPARTSDLRLKQHLRGSVRRDRRPPRAHGRFTAGSQRRLRAAWCHERRQPEERTET